jgi:non-ribosomal peptide synthetase component F
VAQSSASVYDSSVEEIWMAFAAGATLVVADDHTVRLGPDLVPWLRRERVTVMAPTPTLLRATGCQRPDLELPELRLIYTGGEAIPQDLAGRHEVRNTAGRSGLHRPSGGGTARMGG